MNMMLASQVGALLLMLVLGLCGYQTEVSVSRAIIPWIILIASFAEILYVAGKIFIVMLFIIMLYIMYM